MGSPYYFKGQDFRPYQLHYMLKIEKVNVLSKKILKRAATPFYCSAKKAVVPGVPLAIFVFDEVFFVRKNLQKQKASANGLLLGLKGVLNLGFT